MKNEALPVRAGDVFRFDATRWATVMRVIPGGRAELRISGTRNGKPSLCIGEMQVRQVKTFDRAGRAEGEGGYFAPLDHAAIGSRVGS